MPNGKSPEHYGLTKEFYDNFWGDIKFCYFKGSLKQSKNVGRLPISQRQAIIKQLKKIGIKGLSKTADQFRYLMWT